MMCCDVMLLSFVFSVSPAPLSGSLGQGIKKQGVSNRAKSKVKVNAEEEKAADLLNLRQVTLYALYAPTVGQAVLFAL